MINVSLLRANTRQTLARFRALLIAIAVGTALLVTSAAVAGASITADAHALDTASGLTTLELLSVAPSGIPTPLTEAAIASIATLPSVDAAIGAGSVGGSLTYVEGGGTGASAAADQAFAGAFWAMPRFVWSQPPLIRSDNSGEEPALAPGEVVLPNTYLGVSLAPLVGAKITLEYTVATGKDHGMGATMPLRVVGVFDNSGPKRAGDSAMYVSDSDFRRLLSALAGLPGGRLPADFSFESCWIKTASVADANRLAQELTTAGYFVSRGGSETALPRALGLLQQANLILSVALAGFGIGIGVTIAGTWSNLRRWDVGVLASLGWSPGRILASYTTELAIVGGIVGVAAAALGTLLSVGTSLALQSTTVLGIPLPPGVAWPPWLWVVGIVVGAPVVLMAGAAPRIVRLGRIEPDDALRRPD
jgi:ABC-type lipoprotein release transport system permease subunit